MAILKTVKTILLLLCFEIAHAQTLSNQIDALIEQQLPNATIAVVVKDAQTGQVLYQKNANKLLAPASTMKLFTAAAALYQLGPNYHFITALSKKNQDYFITFSGDPSLTINNLTQLFLPLQQAHISTIEGNIVIDSSKYSAPYYADGLSYDDLGWYYAAPDTAVILNENAETYDIITAKSLGKPVTIRPKTKDSHLTLINELTTVSKEQEQLHCKFHIDIQPHNTLRLYGCVSIKDHPSTLQLAIPEPNVLAQQVIENILKNQQITLQKSFVLGQTPPDAQAISVLQSANLEQLIKHMLQTSDNIYANSLLKTLGYSLTGDGTYKQGAFAVRSILGKHTTLDLTQLLITDGAGSRYNQTTALQVVTLLSTLYANNALQQVILNALPQAGVSGTLKERMKNTILDKIVYAKTGTMHDISSLSGYIVKQNANPLVFSIIINGIHTPIYKTKALEEKILVLIYNANSK